MIGYLLRVLGHRFRQGRLLFLLTVLGVALGVASVLCIQILNLNSIGAFSGALEAVSGQADLTVLGHAPTLDETLLPKVLATPGVAAAWPVVDVDVALTGEREEFLQVLGLDVYAATGIPWEGSGDLAAALAVPGWIAVSPQLARERGWEIGSRLGASSGSRRLELEVGALVDFSRVSPTAGSRLAVMDLSQAQHLLGLAGRLHQIDVRLREGQETGAVLARLADRLGPGVRVTTPTAREQETSGLLDAFRLNLTALSLISLVVGFFLIFSATQASLLRRRREFGLLRSLGASRGQVLALILFEVALLGLLGVALGIPLGVLAARLNLDVVSGSLSNLYLLQETESLVLPGWLFPLAALVGLGGALVGGWLPAREVSRRPPRELLASHTLHEREETRALPLARAGLVLLGAAWVLDALGGAALRESGFLLALVGLLTLPLFTPLVVRWVTEKSPSGGFGPGYALRSLGSQLQTTSQAVSALAIAVSMMISITVMIDSFRRTVAVWVEGTLQADVYITSPSWRRAGADAVLDPELVESLAHFPGVRAMDQLRRSFGELEGRRVLVNGIDLGLPGGSERTPLMPGSLDALSRARNAGSALVSEPLARKFSVAVGDTLRLPGIAGPVELRVEGIYYDYTTDLGEITVDLPHFPRLYGPGPPNSLSLYLEPGSEPRAVIDAIRAAHPEAALWIRSNRALRDEVFAIFDQTFAITAVLQLMALLVASCAISLSLLVMAREGSRELALYAALGATRGQVFGVFLGRGLAIALLGLLLGTVAGLALAALLIYRINLVYFGWTIQAHWPAWPVLQESVTILLAAALASLYPALRASRTPIRELSLES